MPRRLGFMGTLVLCAGIAAVLVIVGGLLSLRSETASSFQGFGSEVFGGLMTALIGIPIAFALLRAEQAQAADGERTGRERELEVLVRVALDELKRIEESATTIIDNMDALGATIFPNRVTPYWIAMCGTRYIALTGDSLTLDQVARANEALGVATNFLRSVDDEKVPEITPYMQSSAVMMATTARASVELARGRLKAATPV